MLRLHSTINSLVISLCRAGALLALLQLVVWVANFAETTNHDRDPDPERAIAGIAFLQGVGQPGLESLVGLDLSPADHGETSFEILLRFVREIGRTMLWLVVILALPLGILLGLTAPFMRSTDSYRMLFGTVALLGVIPLARSEAMPVPWAWSGLPQLPETLLAGGGVPLVAAILLGSASVLFDLRRHQPPDPRQALGTAAPTQVPA